MAEARGPRQGVSFYPVSRMDVPVARVCFAEAFVFRMGIESTCPISVPRFSARKAVPM